MMKSVHIPDYLSNRLSFLAGIGRFFDLVGSFDKQYLRHKETEGDLEAIHSDWARVGEVIQSAINGAHKLPGPREIKITK